MARRHSEHVVDGETRRGKLLACNRDLRNTGRIAANFAVLLDAWDFVRSVLLHWSEIGPTTTVLAILRARVVGWSVNRENAGIRDFFNDNRVMM